MRTITMICYDRPGYLRQAVAAIRANAPASLGFDSVHIFAEPKHSPEMRQLLASIECDDTGVPFFVHRNSVKLGVDANGFQALSFVFDTLQSDFNVHIEEDVVISPDALAMCVRYQFNADDPTVLCYCLHNHAGEKPMTGNIELVKREYGFSPYGWAATRFNWQTWLKPEWFTNRWSPDGKERYGWDWSLNFHSQYTRTAHVLVPVVSRATTIGEFGGVNMSPEQWRAEFAGHVIYEGVEDKTQTGAPPSL